MEDLGKLLSTTSTSRCVGSTFHPTQNCTNFPRRLGDAITREKIILCSFVFSEIIIRISYNNDLHLCRHICKLIVIFIVKG